MSIGQQHIHARKRLFTHLEPFPSKDAFKRFLDYLMYVVGLVQWAALLPQIIEIYGKHETGGLSIATWLLLAGFNALWALYGAVHHEKPILISNVLMMFLDIAIVVGILIY